MWFNPEGAYAYGDRQSTFKRFVTDRPDRIEARMDIRCASQDPGTHEDYVHAELPMPSKDDPISVLWSAGYANCVVAWGDQATRPDGGRLDIMQMECWTQSPAD